MRCKLLRAAIVAAILIVTEGRAGAQGLEYFLPDSVTYNPAIPKPKDIIYHEVGEFHVTHDRLVNYMKAVAAWDPLESTCRHASLSIL